MRRWPCPDERLTEIYQIQRVQKFGGMSWLDARELSRTEPYVFTLLHQAALIEAEAEPRARKYAEAKAKREAEREKQAKKRPRLAGAPPTE